MKRRVYVAKFYTRIYILVPAYDFEHRESKRGFVPLRAFCLRNATRKTGLGNVRRCVKKQEPHLK